MLATQRFTFPSGVAFQRMGEEQDGVMMSLASGYLYRCNRTASLVLAALAAGQTVEEAAADLSRHYGIPVERAQHDVAKLIEDLSQRKLICAAP